MRTVSSLFTRADYFRLPEGFPAELIDGQLVKEPSPSYRHQALGTRLLVALVAHVGTDRVPLSPLDVVLGEHDVYQPDLVVLKAVPRDPDAPVDLPLVAVEVLSPSTEARDRRVKLRRLLRAGVEEVWLVDPRARRVEVHRRDGVANFGPGTSVASRALPGFALPVDPLFAPPA